MHRLTTVPKPPEGDDATKDAEIQTVWRRATHKKKISEKEKEAKMSDKKRYQ